MPIVLSRVLTTWLACLSLVLGCAASASAGHRVSSDPAGDTTPDKVAQSDIRMVRSTYGHGRLEVRVRIPKLGRRGFMEVYVDPRHGTTYPVTKMLRVKRTRSGLDAGYFHYSDYIGNVHRYPCRVHGAWSRHRGLVVVRAPKRCIKLSGVKLHVVAYGRSGSSEGYDSVRRIRVGYN